MTASETPLYQPNLEKNEKKQKNFKTNSNPKQSTPGEIKKHEEQIAGVIGS